MPERRRLLTGELHGVLRGNAGPVKGYTLTSPTSGLTTYGLDHTYEGATVAGEPNPVGADLAPYRVSATVNGHYANELIGTVWQAPTTGEWDFDTC